MGLWKEHTELARDESGVAYTEYVILLSVVTVIGSAATAALGIPLLQTYRYAQLVLSLPIP
ncbi:MAG: hypothetical protein AAGF12_27145 [Myxococcota bacterium]